MDNSNSKEIGIKGKQTKCKINPETGLSIYQQSGQKISKTLNTVNPETGLTLAMERGKKTSIGLNREIEPGVTVAQKRNRHVAEKLKIEIEPGITGYTIIGQKSSKTLNTINPETGLTLAMERGKKTSNQLNREVEPGVTVAQKRNRETNKRRFIEVQPGITYNDIICRLSAETQFNRIGYIYNGNTFIGSFSTKMDLNELCQSATLIKMIVTLYDIGGGVIDFAKNSHNKRYWNWLGYEISTTPKSPEHLRLPFKETELGQTKFPTQF